MSAPLAVIQATARVVSRVERDGSVVMAWLRKLLNGTPDGRCIVCRKPLGDDGVCPTVKREREWEAGRHD